jgi:hypothetical protein
MHQTKILDQANFLNTFLDASIFDVQKNDLTDGPSLNQEKPSSNSLADHLCSTLISLLSRVQEFFQEFFDDVLKYFNEKAQMNPDETTQRVTGNQHAFFATSSKPEGVTDKEATVSPTISVR